MVSANQQTLVKKMPAHSPMATACVLVVISSLIPYIFYCLFVVVENSIRPHETFYLSVSVFL